MSGSLTLPTVSPLPGSTAVPAINTALKSVATDQNSGSAPTTGGTGLSSTSCVNWRDTGNNADKSRDEADSTWIVKGTYDETNKIFHPYFQGPVGSFRNLKVTRTSATVIQVQADELIVSTALGGQHFTLPSYSQTLTITGTGAGGMDTGSASASADLSVYAIFDFQTGAASIIGTLGATSNGSVYSGAHAPSVYTASALVGSYKMNGSAQFNTFYQMDRQVVTGGVVISSSLSATSTTNVSLATYLPANARAVNGWSNSGASGTSIAIFTDTANAFQVAFIEQVGVWRVPIITAQTIAYNVSSGSAGTLVCASYEF